MKKKQKKQVELSDLEKRCHALLMESLTKQVESRFEEITGSPPNEESEAFIEKSVAEAIAKTTEFIMGNMTGVREERINDTRRKG